jgi:hypothetical protein
VVRNGGSDHQIAPSKQWYTEKAFENLVGQLIHVRDKNSEKSQR